MMTFKVSPDGGDPWQVVAESRDVLAWEKALKGRSFNDLATNPTMAGLYGLAYAASRRQGLYSGTIGEFEAGVDLELVDDEEDEQEVDPTGSAPSAEPSSGSPSKPASPRPSGRKRASRPSPPRSN
jgi:hypothetical protein